MPTRADRLRTKHGPLSRIDRRRARRADGQIVWSSSDIYNDDGTDYDEDFRDEAGDGVEHGAWAGRTRVRVHDSGRKRITPRPGTHPDEYIVIKRPERQRPNNNWSVLNLGTPTRNGPRLRWNRANYTYIVGPRGKWFTVKNAGWAKGLRWGYETTGLTLNPDGSLTSDSDGELLGTLVDPLWFESDQVPPPLDPVTGEEVPAGRGTWTVTADHFEASGVPFDSASYPLTVDPTFNWTTSTHADAGDLRYNHTNKLISDFPYGSYSMTVGRNFFGYRLGFYYNIQVDIPEGATISSVTHTHKRQSSTGTMAQNIDWVYDTNSTTNPGEAYINQDLDDYHDPTASSSAPGATDWAIDDDWVDLFQAIVDDAAFTQDDWVQICGFQKTQENANNKYWVSYSPENTGYDLDIDVVYTAGSTTYYESPAATTTLTGAVVRETATTKAATATITGAVTRATSKTLAAVATLAAVLSPSKLMSQLIEATTTFTGALSRSVGLKLAATSTLTPTIGRAISIIREATSTLTGAVFKASTKTLEATTTVTAALAKGFQFFRTLAATTAVTADLATQYAVGLLVEATTTITGAVSQVVNWASEVAYAPTLSVAISRATSKILAGTTTVTPGATKQTAKTLAATVVAVPVAATIWATTQSLAATTTITAALLENYIPGGGPPAAVLYNFARKLGSPGRELKTNKTSE